jgi:ribosome-associated protein
MEEPPQQPSAISRSARKRDAKEIEVLAQALVALPAAEFANLPAPAPILAEVAKARITKGHGSLKRQVKFVAGLLRQDLDVAEQLSAFVAGEHQQQRDETRLAHQLEGLRERLCAEATRADALIEVGELFGGIDMLGLKKLLANYRGVADKKNYRQIFRCLREGSALSAGVDEK